MVPCLFKGRELSLDADIDVAAILGDAAYVAVGGNTIGLLENGFRVP